MSLISVQELSRSFGTRTLFEGVSFSLVRGERSALIGANGSGKSTLLATIAGRAEIDDGAVAIQRGTRVVYVDQNASLGAGGTVHEVLLNSVHEHDSVERTITASRWLNRSSLDGTLSIATLSGGLRKRLALVAALAQEPDVLLLDEPTNHLDLDTILWLEQELLSCSAALLFISHDRYLIDSLATRVIELDRRYPGGILIAEGDYGDFLERRTAYLSAQATYADAIANKARRELAWLRRGPKAQRRKSKSRIESAHELLAEHRQLQRPEERLGFDFSQASRKSADLVRFERVTAVRGERTLFTNLSFTVQPGIRLGIVGANGSGKSTLLSLIAGSTEPSSGRIARALGTRIVQFDQHRRTLNPELTLRATLCPHGDSVVFNEKQIHVSGWAKRFLFRNDQLGMRVGSLSGGEQARLILANLMLEPSDLLLLDEPTNDLDIGTLEVLEEALGEYLGGIVLVTHDRYFLGQVATAVIGLDGDGEAIACADYEQWEAYRAEKRAVKTTKTRADQAARGVADEAAPIRSRRAITYAERIELQGMEERIMALEEEVRTLEAQIQAPQGTKEEIAATCQLLLKKQSDLEVLFERWHLLEKKNAGANARE